MGSGSVCDARRHVNATPERSRAKRNLAPALNWRQDAAFTGTLEARRHTVETTILVAS
jgi:hypothetical protein